MDYDNLSSLRTAAGLDYTETLPTSNIDADLAQLSKLSGMSIEQYYLMKPKEKTFPAVDLRIDPFVSYNTPPDIKAQPSSYDLSKLADLLRSSEKEEQIQKNQNVVGQDHPVTPENLKAIPDIATPEQLQYINQQLQICCGSEKPNMEDPVVYTIIQEALELDNIPDYKTVFSIFSALYPKQIFSNLYAPVMGYYGGNEDDYDTSPTEEISESEENKNTDTNTTNDADTTEKSDVILSNIVPEIETDSGGIRYSTLVDESGDVSVLDAKTGSSLNFSGLEAADIKAHVKSTTGSELQIYLSQFFDEDSPLTEAMDGYMSSDDWADEAVQVAEYLAELISEMEGTTLIDTFLIGQLSNFIKRHGIK